MSNELERLINERNDLQRALKEKHITTNEYCSFYHSLSQQIKKLEA